MLKKKLCCEFKIGLLISKQIPKTQQFKLSLQHEQTPPIYLPYILSLETIPVLKKLRSMPPTKKMSKNLRKIFSDRPSSNRGLKKS